MSIIRLGLALNKEGYISYQMKMGPYRGLAITWYPRAHLGLTQFIFSGTGN